MKKQKYVEIHTDDCTVHPQVFAAVTEAINEVLEKNYRKSLSGEQFLRQVEKAVARRMNTETEYWRFCSCYRHCATPAHALVYAMVPTVAANAEADRLRAA